jgi:ATP-dependent DNA helicase RecQ
MNDNPACPICGAPMVLKVARSGANAGGKFWGCSKYPKCKGIISIGEGPNSVNEPDSISDLNSSKYDSNSQKPKEVRLNAMSRRSGFDVQFRQGIAVPYEHIGEINRDAELWSHYIRNGQWRLDHTHPYHNPDRNYSLVASQIRKLIKRGKITLLSPTLEAIFRNLFKPDENRSICNSLKLVSQIKPAMNIDYDFNGVKSEQLFYWDIARSILGSRLGSVIIPQVFHSSFLSLSDSIESTKFDFLMTFNDQCVAIEIDDPRHEGQHDRDEYRDSLLASSASIQTIRVSVDEIENRRGPNFEQLMIIMQNGSINSNDTLLKNEVDRFAYAIKTAFQIEASIIEAIDIGLIYPGFGRVYIDFNSDVFDENEVSQIIKAIEADIIKIFRAMGSLYGIDTDSLVEEFELLPFTESTDGLLITYRTDNSSTMPQMIIQDILTRFQLIDPCLPPLATKIENVDERLLTDFLNLIFRKPFFLEGQFETLSRIMQNKDTIVLLPTGAGKSIIFQLAALLLPGIALVVDPLISLIDDQIENLVCSGIDRVNGITYDARNRGDRERILEQLSEGEYHLFYVSPERLQMEDFRKAIRATSVSRPIPLVAIDEAHCVSEWGHDFRTSYLNLGRTIREYCRNHNQPACIAALTGTASSAVLHDVQRELQILTFDAIITPKSFDRQELVFDVISTKSNEKIQALTSIIGSRLPGTYRSSVYSFYQSRGEQTNCGIVVCPHTNGEYGVRSVSNELSSRLGISTGIYSGQAPKGIPDTSWRKMKGRVAKDFKANRFSVLVATKAFGMGIDKPNIRFTVHYGMPQSPESFYQEAGRAGRDRKISHCYLILSNDFPERNKKLLDFSTEPEVIVKTLDAQDRFTNDDIDRMLYFHARSFRGVEAETASIDLIERFIPEIPVEKHINVSFGRSDDERSRIEKAIHRFVVLGIVKDYIVDFSARQFTLYLAAFTNEDIIRHYSNYVRGYNRGRVAIESDKLRKKIGLPPKEFSRFSYEILVDFIYDTIEKGRRRALSEMLSIAELATQSDDKNQVIRQRIVQYFETQRSAEIDEMLNSENGGLAHVQVILLGSETEDGQVVGEIRSPKEAAELRGEVSRSLESTPDHPGLLVLRALSEVMTSDAKLDAIQESLTAFLKSAKDRYNIDNLTIQSMLAFSLNLIHDKRPDFYPEVITSLFSYVDTKDFAIEIIKNADSDDMLLEPFQYLIESHILEIRKILN